MTLSSLAALICGVVLIYLVVMRTIRKRNAED
jgi:hypothetical protein